MGHREYVLAPAYDLLAVLLADPDDTEEMPLISTSWPTDWADSDSSGKMNLSSNIYYICIEHGAQNILAKVFSRCS